MGVLFIDSLGILKQFVILFQRTVCSQYMMFLSRIDYAFEIYGDAIKTIIKRSQVHKSKGLKVCIKILKYLNL